MALASASRYGQRAPSRGLTKGTTLLVRYWQRLREPSLGAVPIQPYPVNSTIRWVLAGIFVVYLVVVGVRDVRGLGPAMGVAIFAGLLTADVVFLRVRKDPGRMLRAWSWIMFVDIGILLMATTLDPGEHSPIPVMAVATVFSASEMFRPRYVLTMAIGAAIAFTAQHLAIDLARGEMSYATPAINALLIGGVGAFAATRGLADERLRKNLIETEQREREQSESLGAALEAARTSEARFIAFSEHAPALMLLFDAAGNLTFRSSFPAGPGLGGTIERGTPIPGIGLSPADAEVLRQAVSGAIAGDSRPIDITAALPGGRRLRLRGSAFPVDSGAGAILRDVTVELELSAQVSRAQQIETVGTLAGGVAHDFNNLLTAILGNLYLARTEIPEGSPAQAYLQEARTAGERGAELVRRLMDYGRPTLDHLERTDVGRLVRATVELARPALSPQVTVEIQTCDGNSVLGNFGALQQVLLNLLFNARDAMPAGGAIHIECSPITVPDHLAGEAASGNFWQIAVTDSGVGMSPETCARIFDPFFTTKDVGAGSGLGLATSLRIVQAHGGTITVETEEGVGSTFRVLLPPA